MRKFLAILFCVTLISCTSTQVDQSVNKTVYQLDQVDAPSKWTVHVSPKYPKRAAKDKIEGWVKMSAVVTENGMVSDSQPKGVFEKAAKSAFSKWYYRPAFLNGKKVKVYREETVEFKI